MRSKLFWVVAFSVFAIPLSGILPVEGTDLWFSQYLGLFFCLNLGISVVLWKFNKYLAVFTGVCLLSTAFTMHFHMRAVLCMVQINLGCLAMYGVSKLTKRERSTILKVVVAFVVLQGIWVVAQYKGVDPVFDYVREGVVYPDQDDTVGLSGSRNQLGVFFAVTMPVVIQVLPCVVPLAAFGLFCATTTSAWAGCIAACLAYSLTRSRKAKVWLATGLLVGSVLFFWVFENPAVWRTVWGRLTPARVAVESVNNGEIVVERDNVSYRIRCNPWFGFGLGNFLRIFPFYPDKTGHFNSSTNKYVHLHNDIGETIFELGRVGAISLFLLIGNFFVNVYKSRRCKEAMLYASCIIGYFVCSLGVFASYISVSVMWLILFYGMFEGARRNYGANTGVA